jgi:hypothetical protein
VLFVKLDEGMEKGWEEEKEEDDNGVIACSQSEYEGSST